MRDGVGERERERERERESESESLILTFTHTLTHANGAVPTGWKYFGNIMDHFEKEGGKAVICGEESFGTGALSLSLSLSLSLLLFCSPNGPSTWPPHPNQLLHQEGEREKEKEKKSRRKKK